MEDNMEARISALKVLSELAPRIPVIVLAYNNDAELARTVDPNQAKAAVTLVNRLAGREDFPPGIMSTLPRLGKFEEKLFSTVNEIY